MNGNKQRDPDTHTHTLTQQKKSKKRTDHNGMSEEESQLELKRQKDAIRQLRQEKSALQEQLAAAQGSISHGGGARYGISNDPAHEAGLLIQKQNALRRKLDREQQTNEEKRVELKQLLEKKEDLMIDSQPLLTEGSGLAQKIRTLENRLDKALIKHNEAVAIRRTYDDILQRLEAERVGYDNQLAAIEKTLRAKEHDNKQLEQMAQDARYARDAALLQVQRFKEAYAAERQQREKEMEDRHAYVQSQFSKAKKQEQQAKLLKEKDEAELQARRAEEERQRALAQMATTELRTEEEEQRLQQLSAAYRKIRDVTRAVNVDQVIAMFAAQRDTFASLAASKEDIEHQIEELQITRAELRRKLDETKYSGTGTMGSRRIVDEFESHLSEARALLDKTMGDFQRISTVFMGVRAGGEHLNEKLSRYKSDEIVPTPVTEANILDALAVIEKKLEFLKGETSAEVDTASQMLQTIEVYPHPNNLRVKMMTVQEEEVALREAAKNDPNSQGSNDHHDDDPHDREALKRMSQSAVTRHEQMKKKKEPRGSD